MGVNLGETSYLISLSIQQFDENIQAIVSETLSLSPRLCFFKLKEKFDSKKK